MEAAEDNRISKGLREEIKKATKDDKSLSNVQQGVINYIIREMIILITPGKNKKADDRFNELLERLKRGEEEALQAYFEAERERDYKTIVEAIGNTVNFVMGSVDIILEEIDLIENERKKDKGNALFDI